MQIHADSHQLGHGDGGMGIVQLDRHSSGQGMQIAIDPHMPPHEVLQRGGGEEILLPQAQFLPGRGFIAGVEHLGNRLLPHLIRQGAQMVAMVEGFQRERVGRAGGPEAQRVHMPAAPADDRRVIGHGLDDLAGLPDLARAIAAVDDGDIAAKADLMGDFRSGEFPRIAEGQPILRHLALPAAHDLLPEQAMIIADAIAKGGDAQGR